MKRSEINQAIDRAKQAFAAHAFRLPEFADWTPAHWKSIGPQADGIRNSRLGWDVTDFNLGEFNRKGLTLFTLRNGNPSDPTSGKTYCEKIMLAREGQLTLFHTHRHKVEDIINRGGGVLVVELFNGDLAGVVNQTPVVVSRDGISCEVPPGGQIELDPGESVTLMPGQYHQFIARGADVVIGEVSTVNDDASDNVFIDPIPRFPCIEEDEAPACLLCNEYPST
jgi:D-lyxose ketol-isomerase